jgi:hypothetical protein
MGGEKAGNVAAFAFVVSAAMLLLIYLGPSGAAYPKEAAMGLVGSVFTGSLGYMFGRSGHSKP